ncbi:fatty acid hydroxylase [Allomuricauda ruestringensis DSM 13258]|uniref:Fatty acid hydroxylase n=1 Tax=Allomuricauda ruestringensis (strain DSM 13258 / CIP 107369 / LMG 19739 / B1) TaxID=886377 RepID=G2PK50_ALLRU|nr:sterol desaturase family protein [Allomuricauda ruestringensis]AEM72035.1 fatty acid hydroxylase [Allomuricauda ruestringensis DSM 13258]
MPTPLEILLDPVSLIILAIYAVLMIWEALFPARQLPLVKYWKLKGMIFFVLFFYLSSYLPLIWDGYLAEYQLMDLTGLGTLWGALVGVLLYQFGVYVWHRAMHRSNVLWRVFHQMHHSVERIDTYSAFIFSPMDMIGFTALGSLLLVLVAGFTPQAATVIILVNTFFSMFQHSNIRTPAWLGYIVQRPEAHALHHAKGIHAYNYGDITIYDILFGTWKNPKDFEYENGFYMGASSKITDMLLFKDILETNDSKSTEKNPQ